MTEALVLGGGGVAGIAWIAPLANVDLFPVEKPLAQAVEELRAGDAEVAVVGPDEASWTAMGANPLDPSTRQPAAEAGRAQGQGLKIEWSRA